MPMIWMLSILACSVAEPPAASAPATEQPDDSNSTVTHAGATVVVHYENGLPQMGKAATEEYVLNAMRATTAWYGAFPMERADVFITVKRGEGMWSASAWGGLHPHVRMNMGRASTADDCADDWKLPHEMIHLGVPEVPRQNHWLEEGIATYAEPWGRVQTDQLTANKAWYDLVQGLPNGTPKVGDRGLDHTPSWGRTYWGGALFCLLADIEIRTQSGNTKGLQHALAGVVAAGGNIGHHWSMDRILSTGDKATGTTGLVDTYTAMKDTPHPVDLAAMWRQLGVVLKGKTVRFDDDAPLAHIRRGITAGDAQSGTKLAAP